MLNNGAGVPDVLKMRQGQPRLQGRGQQEKGHYRCELLLSYEVVYFLLVRQLWAPGILFSRVGTIPHASVLVSHRPRLSRTCVVWACYASIR